MSNFAEQLKSEIARIAKKEIRAESKALKQLAQQQRADMAALKRRVAELELTIKRWSQASARKTGFHCCSNGAIVRGVTAIGLSLGDGQISTTGQPVVRHCRGAQVGEKASTRALVSLSSWRHKKTHSLTAVGEGRTLLGSGLGYARFRRFQSV